jgi:hypothetical protein
VLTPVLAKKRRKRRRRRKKQQSKRFLLIVKAVYVCRSWSISLLPVL